MIAEEQIICIQCKAQFSEVNIPRLLTMCGHTFCQKCIRQLMSKRKMNNKYRLTCPIDKQTTELSTPNPTIFPKNLSVLSLAKKKFQISSSSRRISINSKVQHESMRSKESKATIALQSQLMISTNSKIKEEEKKQNNQKDCIFQQASHDTCLLHQKKLQLVCVRDFQKICPSCVIFGEHRGHNVKNVAEVEDTIISRKLAFKTILKQTKNCFQKLESNQILKLIEGMLQRKKSMLLKQIAKRFHRLREQIMVAEKKSLLKLEKRIDDYKNQFMQNLEEKKLVREKYRDWEQNLKEKINLLSNQNEEEKLKAVLKSDNFLQVSERNLEMFKYLEQDFLQESEKKLQNLALNSDQQEIKKHLKSYCKFEDSTNSFLQMNASRITQISNLLHQQILLDDIQDHPEHPEPTQACKVFQKSFIQSSSNSRVKPFDQLSCMSILDNANSKLNRIKSSGKQFPKDNKLFLSPRQKNSDLKSSKIMMGTERSLLNGLVRSKEIPQKYEKKLEAIANGTSDTLDLTNGQLTNDKVLAIVEYAKDYPVTIVKLVKNKITDECLVKLVPYFNNVVMLNISKNELTERSIEFILNFRKQGGLRCLKSLMIGQNKIIERKNKQMLDQLRKMGINICN